MLSDRFRNVDLYEVQTKKSEQKSIYINPYIYIYIYNYISIYVRLQLQLQFIIHLLPVSSGFHMDISVLSSALSTHYTVQGPCSTNTQLSSAFSRVTLSASGVC